MYTNRIAAASMGAAKRQRRHYLAQIGLGTLVAAGMLVGVSDAAQADPDISDIGTQTNIGTDNGTMARIHSVVYWTGPQCIPIRAPEYPNGYHTIIKVFCGGYSEGNYSAYPGEYVGADPMPNDTTTSLGCALYINGYLDNQDFAPPGDHHDVNCLRILIGYGPESAQGQM